MQATVVRKDIAVKKDVVRLSEDERSQLSGVISKGMSRRAGS